MSPTVDRLRDPQQRQERARRILDVAAALLLRHGYRRVTIDDVAAGAEIGKGTVYLHWKSREALFTAVFEREVVQAIGELLQVLRRDPQLSLLHRFARTYFLAIMHLPLLRGFVLGDPDLLGKLAQPRGSARDDRHRLMSRGYFQLLAEYRLLREDLDVDAIAYAFQATFEGFLQAEAAAAAPTPAGQAAAGLDQRADLPPGPSSGPSRADTPSPVARSSPSPPPSSTCSPTWWTPTAPTSASPKPDRQVRRRRRTLLPFGSRS